MARGVVTIGLGASIEDAARLMMEEEVTHLPVISEDRLGGELGEMSAMRPE